MISFEELNLTATASGQKTVAQADFEDLKFIFVIVCGVFGAVTVVIIGCVIGLFVLIHNISLSLKNRETAAAPMLNGKILDPKEELARRYTMFGENNKGYRESPVLARNFSTTPTNMKGFDESEQNKKEESFNRPDGLAKQLYKQQKHPNNSRHLVGNRLRDDLFY